MRKEYRRQKAKERFIKYMRRTWKNKLLAIGAVCCTIPCVVIEHDVTATFLALFFAIPMFFSRRDWTV